MSERANRWREVLEWRASHPCPPGSVELRPCNGGGPVEVQELVARLGGLPFLTPVGVPYVMDLLTGIGYLRGDEDLVDTAAVAAEFLKESQGWPSEDRDQECGTSLLVTMLRGLVMMAMLPGGPGGGGYRVQ